MKGGLMQLSPIHATSTLATLRMATMTPGSTACCSSVLHRTWAWTVDDRPSWKRALAARAGLLCAGELLEQGFGLLEREAGVRDALAVASGDA